MEFEWVVQSPEFIVCQHSIMPVSMMFPCIHSVQACVVKWAV